MQLDTGKWVTSTQHRWRQYIGATVGKCGKSAHRNDIKYSSTGFTFCIRSWVLNFFLPNFWKVELGQIFENSKSWSNWVGAKFFENWKSWGNRVRETEKQFETLKFLKNQKLGKKNTFLSGIKTIGKLWKNKFFETIHAEISYKFGRHVQYEPSFEIDTWQDYNLCCLWITGRYTNQRELDWAEICFAISEEFFCGRICGNSFEDVFFRSLFVKSFETL